MNPFVLKAVVANSWVGGGQHYSHSVKPVRVSKPGGMTFSTKIARRYCCLYPVFLCNKTIY